MTSFDVLSFNHHVHKTNVDNILLYAGLLSRPTELYNSTFSLLLALSV
jgi:hypothetical protein